MKIKFKTTVIAFTLISVLALLCGCHTTAGFGEDVSRGGKAIERAANK